MKLSKLFGEVLNENNVWSRLESILKKMNPLTEITSSRMSLFLVDADKFILDKFGIERDSEDYFIAGSAALYLYPELVVAMIERDASFPSQIGDLDMVIPNKELWVKAGLTEELEAGGIYRPKMATHNIEAFTEWDPKKAGGPYANVNVRSEAAIMNDSSIINGYRFMSLQDVFHYKYQMNRKKEAAIGELINSHGQSGTPEQNLELVKGVANIVTSQYGNEVKTQN
jgi:hypothetical protein